MGWSRSEKIAGTVVALMTIVLIGYALMPEQFSDVGYVMLAIGHATGGVLMLSYGRRSTSADARSFRWIGVAALSAALGIVVVVVVASISEVPPYGPLDIFFLGAYVMFLRGLAAMPTVSRGWKAETRVILDGLVGAISLAAVLWETGLSSVFRVLDDFRMEVRVIATIYPILSTAMLLGIMFVILRRGTYRFDVRLLALSVAFGLQAMADLEYLSSATSGSFSSAQPNLLPFLGASLLVALTGLLVRSTPTPTEVPDRSTPVWSYAFPYMVALGLLTLFIYRSIVLNVSVLVLEVASLLVMLLVIGRQSLAIQENRTKVDAERRSLIASVSHELRTPLTSMIGFLSLLDEARDTLSEDERVEIFDIVLDQANYMGRMVTDIVLLARDTPQQMTLSQSLVPAGEYVSAIIDTLGAEANRIEFDIDSTMMIRIDVDRARQAVTNLLTNALRYGAGRCLLVVKTDGSDVVIEIHDDGPGVPKKYHRTIWERFERGPNELNATVPGTGLGLAIVDLIAKAHGGEAAYRVSERLGGACFSLVLTGRVVSSHHDEPEISRSSLPASVHSQ